MADAVDERGATASVEAEAERLARKGTSPTVIAAILLIGFLGGALKIGPVADLIEASTAAHIEIEKTEFEQRRAAKIYADRLERLEAEAAARAAGGP